MDDGVTNEQARDFYRAAASYYREAPWRTVAEGESIELKCVQLDGGPWYAIVLGKECRARGLMLFDDKESWQLMKLADAETIAERLCTIALSFEGGRQLNPADLMSIRQQKFEVAGPRAYPQPFRMETGGRIRPLVAWELELLEACLWVIPDFLKRAEDRSPDVLEYAFHGMIGKMTFNLAWGPKTG